MKILTFDLKKRSTWLVTTKLYSNNLYSLVILGMFKKIDDLKNLINSTQLVPFELGYEIICVGYDSNKWTFLSMELVHWSPKIRLGWTELTQIYC